jgi:ABC-type uncharacterized transport system involved in gliding motility auxiliary subunit
MLKKIRFLIIIAAACIIFAGVNVISKSIFAGKNYDFTQAHIFTISDDTKKFLSQIKEPLHIRLFYTSKLAQGLPVFQSYYGRIENLLRQYERLSNGKITIEMIEPEPFSEQEDLAVSHGIEGVPIDAAGDKFYFGASVENATDDRRTIAFFDPERAQFLEYDLTKMLGDISNLERKKIGLLSYLPIRGGGDFRTSASFTPPTPQWAILNQTEEQFEVRDIAKNAPFIPDDIDILLLVHPHNLSLQNYFAIEQFLMRGGKALIFMDSSVNLSAQEVITSDFSTLLEHWGIEFSGENVAAEKELAIPVQSLASNSVLQSYPKLNWLEIGKNNLSKDSVITAPLQKLRMIESGFFAANEDSKLQFNPLISTDSTAASIKADIAAKDNAEESMKLFNNFVPEGKKLHLAAQISGNIDALINVDALELKDEKLKELLQQRFIKTPKQPINVVLVGDSDMLRNEFWARITELFGRQMITPEADNGAFALNALELLSGDNFLIGLRTRGNEVRRFTVLDEMRKSASEEFQREENELKMRLKEMEERLKQLQADQQNGDELFSEAQTKEIASFKQLFLKARKELRAVQHNLNDEIAKLGNLLALINIFTVPILIALLSIFLPKWLRNHNVKKVRKL